MYIIIYILYSTLYTTLTNISYISKRRLIFISLQKRPQPYLIGLILEEINHSYLNEKDVCWVLIESKDSPFWLSFTSFFWLVKGSSLRTAKSDQWSFQIVSERYIRRSNCLPRNSSSQWLLNTLIMFFDFPRTTVIFDEFFLLKASSAVENQGCCS